MKKPMTNFKVETPQVELHTFVKGRSGLVYAEKGLVKTYSNKTQAQKRVDLLTGLGFKCGVSFAWPFTIQPLV